MSIAAKYYGLETGHWPMFGMSAWYDCEAWTWFRTITHGKWL